MTIPALNIVANESFNSLYSETKYISYSKASVEQNQSKSEKSSTEENTTTTQQQSTVETKKEPSTVVSIANKQQNTSSVETSKTNTMGEQLTAEQAKVVEQLKQRDQVVRQHEQAHISAGQGIILSGPTYDYQTGPDGKRYAIGGEVRIDTSMPDNPEDALTKAQKIKSAALAPSEPSSQDLMVARKAQSMEQTARQELARVEQYKKTAEQGEGPVDSVTAYNNVPMSILGLDAKRSQDTSSSLRTPSSRVSFFTMINGDLKMNSRNIMESMVYSGVNVNA